MLKSKTTRKNPATVKKSLLRASRPTAEASAKHETKTPRSVAKHGTTPLQSITKRTDTKLAAILGMLGQPKGASIEELIKATAWQAHSVRGAISGTIKKKLGLVIVSEKVDGKRRYRVAKA